MLFADVEGDDLLPGLTRLWCIVIGDETGRIAYADQRGYPSLKEGLKRLSEADQIVFHNGTGYDYWAIEKLYPGTLRMEQIVDSLILCRMLWPGQKHGLEVLGSRLNKPKGDFKDFSRFTPEMVDYCLRDVEILQDYWRFRFSPELKGYPQSIGEYYEKFPQACECEFWVSFALQVQQAHGFRLDVAKARKLEMKLRGEQRTIEYQLQSVFPPKVTPRVSEKTGKLLKPKVEEFNPGSRDMIAARLIERYGWKPDKFTPTGKPQVDESTLKPLPFPEAKLLVRYMTVQKKLGMLADGDNGWLKLVDANGYVHGSVLSVGARTHRMSHFAPNMAQVDSDPEMRELWIPDEGDFLVGVDADSLELRMLAHYLGKSDGGAFAHAVDQGRKEDGTDPHTLTMRAVGFRDRDNTKTLRYAYLYGAGDAKLGRIAREDNPELVGSASSIGAEVRKKLELGVQGQEALTSLVHRLHRKQGWLPSVDLRPILSESEHSALNTLLQSAGGIVMKYALMIFFKKNYGLISMGYIKLCANVHDEWQMSVHPDWVEYAKQDAVEAIVHAGLYLKLRCPLKGNADVGASWKDTH